MGRTPTITLSPTPWWTTPHPSRRARTIGAPPAPYNDLGAHTHRHRAAHPTPRSSTSSSSGSSSGRRRYGPRAVHPSP